MMMIASSIPQERLGAFREIRKNRLRGFLGRGTGLFASWNITRPLSPGAKSPVVSARINGVRLPDDYRIEIIGRG
jgi:hypothetical protein